MKETREKLNKVSDFSEKIGYMLGKINRKILIGFIVGLSLLLGGVIVALFGLSSGISKGIKEE